jgi:hypothetical protein
VAIRRLDEAVGRLRAATSGRERRGLSHDEADDVAGTVATDDAIGFNPLPLLRALHRYGAEVVVIGQVAGIMHGSAELTGDLDLLWDGAPGHAPALAAAFASVGASLADDDGSCRATLRRSAVPRCYTARRWPAGTAGRSGRADLR